MGDAREGARLPGGIALYVGGVAGAGVLAVVAAVALLARDTLLGGPLRVDRDAVVAAAAIAVGFGVLRRYPFTLYWREHRLVVSLDEAAIFVGLLVMPAPLLALAVIHATVFIQWWGGPAQVIKRVFNVAQYGVAGAIAAGLFIGLRMMGAPELLSAAAASAAFGTSANILLSGVFASLAREPLWKIFRERFLVQGANSTLIGVAGGLTIVGLWRLHPLATFSLVPFAFLVRSYWRLYASADRELDVHKHVANAVHDLVGSSSVPAVAERVLTECERLLDAGRAEIRLTGGDAGALSRNFGSGPQRAEPVTEELPARGGGTLGEIAVWPRQGKQAFGDQERAILRTIAGQAASAIQNASAIAEADAARQRLDTYLSTAQDAVLLVDVAGWIRYLNPAAERLLGVLDAMPVEAQRYRARDFFSHSLVVEGAIPQQARLVEGEGHTLDGSRTFFVEAHLGPVREGGATGTLMVVRDVTERKRLEDDLSRQRDVLAQSEKLSTLGTLVAGVAHEINNPLTFMRGNLQLCRDSLKRRLDDGSITGAERRFAEDLAEEVGIALEGVDRISQIAVSLKNVAKRGTVERRPEDINALLTEVIAVVKTGIPRSVRLELDLAKDLPRIHARASELHQVLLNLIKNAVEALEGRAEGRVRVRTWFDGERVVTEVSDNGVGIPPEVEKQLFTAFFTTKPKGTGLGLNISRDIVKAHGGEMSLASEPGKGTTFLISLPAMKAEAPDTVAGASSS